MQAMRGGGWNWRRVSRGLVFLGVVMWGARAQAGTEVMTAGINSLGRGPGVTSTTFVRVPGTEGVASISAGYAGVVIVMQDKTLKAWGYNTFNGLMTGSDVPAVVPGYTQVKQVACGAYFTAILFENGTVCASGYKVSGPQLVQEPLVPIPGLTGVTAIACGSDHTLALMSDGTVKAFGHNGFGQLGTGNTTNQSQPVTIPGLSNVVAIGCGSWHSFAVLAHGTVVTWGWNTLDGLGRAGDNTVPLSCGLSGAVSVSGGDYHSVAALGDGTAHGWGYNGAAGSPSWILGFSTPDYPWSQTAPRAIPGLSSGVAEVKCGSYFNLARMQDGSLKGFGWNSSGALGLGHTTDAPTPTTVPGVSQCQAVACGYEFSAIIVSTPGAFSGAVNLGGGWKWLNWFGFFNDAGNGWVYHDKHHWMYAVGTTPTDIWFWTSDMGWLWSGSTTYPFLYRVSDGAWLWYNGSSSPRWFMNMTASRWESH